MTNEELAVAIQGGDSSLSEVLWDQVKGFVWQQARRWAAAWHSRKYFDADDLAQSGYIAMVNAVQLFAPEEGTFMTILNYCVLTEFSKVVGCRTKAQRQDPLSDAYSLDEPLGGDPENSLTLADTIEAEEPGFEAVEEAEFRNSLAKAVRDAVAALPDRQRMAVELHYLKGKSYREIADELSVSESRAGQIGQEALKALRKGRYSSTLSEFLYGDRNYYKGTGVGTWKRTGCSAVEREVEYREIQWDFLKYLLMEKGMHMAEALEYMEKRRDAER